MRYKSKEKTAIMRLRERGSTMAHVMRGIAELEIGPHSYKYEHRKKLGKFDSCFNIIHFLNININYKPKKRRISKSQLMSVLANYLFFFMIKIPIIYIYI